MFVLWMGEAANVGIHYKKGKPKGMPRTLTKSRCKYGGNPLKVKDFARSNIVAETSYGLAFAMLLADQMSHRSCHTTKFGAIKWRFVRLKNGFKLNAQDKIHPHLYTYHVPFVLANIQLESVEIASDSVEQKALTG